MPYEITGSFRLTLPADYQEMGARLAEVSEAWTAFVDAHLGNGADAMFELLKTHEAGNGAKRGRPRKIAPGAYAAEPLAPVQ